MKKITLILLLLLIPLTLASETQHRCKVYVRVEGDDEQATHTIEAHLKRELRLIGDVDIVGREGDWRKTISVFYTTLHFKNGTKTGWFTIGYYFANRVPKRHFVDGFKDFYDNYQPVVVTIRGGAYYSRDTLPEFCINTVNSFDKKELKYFRELFKN